MGRVLNGRHEVYRHGLDMRITQDQARIIREQVGRNISPNTRVWLFGSRADDTQRGGDIDLFIEADHPLEDRIATACRIASNLQLQLGDQRIDILLVDPATVQQPIHRIAKETGILL